MENILGAFARRRLTGGHSMLFRVRVVARPIHNLHTPASEASMEAVVTGGLLFFSLLFLNPESEGRHAVRGIEIEDSKDSGGATLPGPYYLNSTYIFQTDDPCPNFLLNKAQSLRNLRTK
jgi:hypothetical protein